MTFDKNENNLRPILSGGGLDGEYILEQMHFHWLSEHTYAGNRFPLEGHLVHYKVDYGNLKNATEKHDGLTVLGIFYELTPDDFESFLPIDAIIADIRNESTHASRKVLIHSFLPQDLSGFYRYNGSLTTPPCSEVVLWTIFSNTARISKKQVKLFSTIFTSHGPLLKNYREIQDINNRNIFHRRSPLTQYSQSDKLSLSHILIFTLVGVKFSFI